jgi:hypothetical protein
VTLTFAAFIASGSRHSIRSEHGGIVSLRNRVNPYHFC